MNAVLSILLSLTEDIGNASYAVVRSMPHIQGYSGFDAMSASYHSAGAQAYEVPVSTTVTPYETPVSTSKSKAGMAAYQLPSLATGRGSGCSGITPDKTLVDNDPITGSHPILEVDNAYDCVSAEAYESSVDHNRLRHYQ